MLLKTPKYSYKTLKTLLKIIVGRCFLFGSFNKRVKITDEMPAERLLTWYRLTRIQENVREKHPGITTALAGNDKLLVDDKMITWDVNRKKIVTKAVYTLPRRDKNR